MSETTPPELHALELDPPIWERVFTVAPLVVVGTREPDGSHDLAPKHLAMPLSWEAHFGFVCTPAHATYRNARREGCFTVSFPRPDQVLSTSLAAAPRCDDGAKHALAALPVFPARVVDGVLLHGAYLFLECELERVVDGFGENSLVAGRVVAAHVVAGALRDADHDDAELLAREPLLCYLHPCRFARVADTFAFPFHAGFRR
jgi:flavin reductase (DIM6/NTAB) family NADH-FMN oxidoreductase RutF